MRTVRNEGVIGLAWPAVVLTVLTVTTGLGPAAWLAGLLCASATTWLVVCGRVRAQLPGPSAADRVTLVRAGLVAAVTASVVQLELGAGSVAATVALAGVALALDWVDGRVARRTDTASEFGARFDMEVDAFAILVLCVGAGRVVGYWVLVLGAARYLFVAAGWLTPWMQARLPYRYWRKPVAAAQGIGLLLATSGLVPVAVSAAVLSVCLLLLAESFGRDVLWLWRRRPERARRRVMTARDVREAQ